MHMTKESTIDLILEPEFSYTKKKSLDKETTNTTSKKTVLLVKYDLPDDEIYGEGKQSKQISEAVKLEIRQMINNLPKLEKEERIPYQDVVFKNLEKIFDDHRRSLPGSYIKPCKQAKERVSQKEKHRVSISILPVENSNKFDVEEQSYHNSDKNFEYDMKIVIKKIPTRPQSREHPLKKYLTGRLAEYEF